MTEDDTAEALRRPLTEDEVAFGRRQWIYCGMHLRPHLTGWCSVPNSHKFKLDVETQEQAYSKCRANSWTIFGDAK